MENKKTHWADKEAFRITMQLRDKEVYTCASGITPSGTIHIGNFRELISTELVVRALKDLGKNVRFIFSWDDFDVFRKIPADADEKEILEKFLRYPITEVPDTYDHAHSSYAEHNEKEVENTIPVVGIRPEFIYQAKKYKNCDYAEQIKHALDNKEEIKKILDKYRAEEKTEDWQPVSVFCSECRKDTTNVTGWDGNYSLTYECACGHKETFDFRKKGIVKLPWRIDWPMRWKYESVNFEPSGKEHSTQGGSRTTGNEIFEMLYKEKPPLHMKYDFITIKGTGGKISKSLGNVISLGDTLEIYEPEIVRYLFASTRPDAEFAVAFDLDVIKIYEDFDKCERIFFGEEKVNEDNKIKQSRIYELSMVDKVPDKILFQPSFRHLTTVLQINEMDIDKTISSYGLEHEADISRLKARIICAKNWLEKYAPPEFKFSVQSEVSSDLALSDSQKKALRDVSKVLLEKEWEDVALHEEFYVILHNNNLEVNDFFSAAYGVLIGKEKGPKLASFVLSIGRQKVGELFGKV